MNYLEAQNLINVITRHCAVNSLSHEAMIGALLMILYSDMRANPAKEHNLHDEDGVLLVNVRLME